MSSSHSSRFLLVLVAIVISAGIATGVTVSDENTPADAEVGTTVEVSYTLEELFQDPNYEVWTLRGETELRNVTWTFELVDQAGNVGETNNADGQNVTQALSIDDGTSEVEVQVTGTVPPVEAFSYDPAPAFLVAELTHTREGGSSSSIERFEAGRYTDESREAREAIESAESVVESSESDQAQESLQSAISAYEGENFELAIQLAERAEREANQAEQAANQARQRNQLIVYGAIGLVVLLVVVGVVYWFVNRDTASRL